MNKTTKKILVILAVALIAMPLFTFYGCKKGEDDPFLSLRSRNARITGEWELSSANESSTTSSTDLGTTTTIQCTETFSGGIWIDNNCGGTASTSSYLETLTINKDGSYHTRILEDGDLWEQDGNWWWIDSKKKKVIISFDDWELEVIQLKNKEIKLKDYYKYNCTNCNGVDSYSRTWDDNYTYTKK